MSKTNRSEHASRTVIYNHEQALSPKIAFADLPLGAALTRSRFSARGVRCAEPTDGKEMARIGSFSARG